MESRIESRGVLIHRRNIGAIIIKGLIRGRAMVIGFTIPRKEGGITGIRGTRGAKEKRRATL